MENGPPIDVATNPDFNLLHPTFVMIVVGLIKEKRFFLIHFAPPCSSFSIALNSDRRSAVRSSEYPEGLPNLVPYKQEKVQLGNALADITVTLASAQHETENLAQIEQPWRSLMLQYKNMVFSCPNSATLSTEETRVLTG